MKKKPAVLDRRLKLEYRYIGELVPNPKNARTHPPEQIAKIVGIIRRIGFVVPVLVDEKGTILKGHGSLMAAKQLGRICYAIDLEPKWADVGIRRWQQMTSKHAIHVHDRKPFDERAPRKAKAR